MEKRIEKGQTCPYQRRHTPPAYLELVQTVGKHPRDKNTLHGTVYRNPDVLIAAYCPRAFYKRTQNNRIEHRMMIHPHTALIDANDRISQSGVVVV